MASTHPFSFKWSLKRNSTGAKKEFSVSANQSYKHFQNEELNDFDQNIMHQSIPDQKDDCDQGVQPYGAVYPIEKIQETMFSRLHVSEKDESLRSDGEPIRAVKKSKLSQQTSSSLSAMDVDSSSSAKAASNKEIDSTDPTISYTRELEEFHNIKSNYYHWLSGRWVPSKQDALELLMHSKILNQRIQEIAKVNRQEQEMKNILEMSSALIESLKGSIAECDACSIELMDYSSGLDMMEKMTTELNELEISENCLSNWSPPSNHQASKSKERVVSKETEEASSDLLLGIFNENESPRENNNIIDHTQLQVNSVLRAKKVREIRAILLPKIIDMLENFEQWSEKHLNSTMQDFLDIKRKEPLLQKSSVDDTINFVVEDSDGKL